MVTPEFEVKRPVLVGDTADVYLQRTLTILRNESINPDVAMEFAPQRAGVFCGVSEVKTLLARVLPETGREVWALEEGAAVEAGEVALRVKAPYSSIGLYETAISGALSSGTAWATAARECVDAADGTPVVSLGARHVHPNVVADMDYAAIVGGCVSCSTIQGARLAGVTPAGNMPHSLPILVGGSVAAMQAFDTHMPQEVPRIALVDTFRDEAEESLNVARAMGDKLRGVCLATPPERGGVTIELVREVRSRLGPGGLSPRRDHGDRGIQPGPRPRVRGGRGAGQHLRRGRIHRDGALEHILHGDPGDRRPALRPPGQDSGRNGQPQAGPGDLGRLPPAPRRAQIRYSRSALRENIAFCSSRLKPATSSL